MNAVAGGASALVGGGEEFKDYNHKVRAVKGGVAAGESKFLDLKNEKPPTTPQGKDIVFVSSYA